MLAEEDPNYNPLSNFRPGNVTSLDQLHAWVGSYVPHSLADRLNLHELVLLVGSVVINDEIGCTATTTPPPKSN